MSRIVKVVESTDHREVYGYLRLENVSINEVQEKINEIKNDEKFLKENPDWCNEDILKKFPKEWEWNFISDKGEYLEV